MDIEVQKALIQGVATVLAAIVVAIVGAWVAHRFAAQRERQARDKEWINQAIELTKIDIDRKVNTWSEEEKRAISPPIIDFLAYYRDLKKLDEYTPTDLYKIISERHIAPRLEERRDEAGYEEEE